jgi:hypothetical protein
MEWKRSELAEKYRFLLGLLIEVSNFRKFRNFLDRDQKIEFRS